ncbi:hypothetical protein STEG23_003717 [Scotinomys teguina]
MPADRYNIELRTSTRVPVERNECLAVSSVKQDPEGLSCFVLAKFSGHILMEPMPFNRRMDMENVVHIHNGVYYAAEKNNDIMKFASKWMELENVILSKKLTPRARIAAAFKVDWVEALPEYIIKSLMAPAANQVGVEFRHDHNFSPRMSERMSTCLFDASDIYFK